MGYPLFGASPIAARRCTCEQRVHQSIRQGWNTPGRPRLECLQCPRHYVAAAQRVPLHRNRSVVRAAAPGRHRSAGEARGPLIVADSWAPVLTPIRTEESDKPARPAFAEVDYSPFGIKGGIDNVRENFIGGGAIRHELCGDILRFK